jgi:hypothetical protein
VPKSGQPEVALIFIEMVNFQFFDILKKRLDSQKNILNPVKKSQLGHFKNALV